MNIIYLLLGFTALSVIRGWFARDWFEIFSRLGLKPWLYLWSYAVLFLPGTVLHEMGHFLTAAILGLRTGKIELLPAIEDNQVRLGHVAVEKADIVRLFLVGIAPTGFGLAVILALPLDTIGWHYILFTIGSQMMPSQEDLKTAFPVLLILTILSLVGYTTFNDQFSNLVYTINNRVSVLVPKLLLLITIMLIAWLTIRIWNHHLSKRWK